MLPEYVKLTVGAPLVENPVAVAPFQTVALFPDTLIAEPLPNDIARVVVTLLLNEGTFNEFVPSANVPPLNVNVPVLVRLSFNVSP